MYLLDTNALIILLFGEVAGSSLSQRGLESMLSAEKLFLSIVSLWEMAIKIKINKLQIKSSIQAIEQNCRTQGIEIVPVKSAHADMTLELPLLDDHKDPFDRLILATSIVENIPLITTDNRMRRTEYLEFHANVIW